MSHRAIIGVKDDATGDYDLYYSQNGAEDLYLYDILSSTFSESSATMQDVYDAEPKNVPEVEKWESGDSTNMYSGELDAPIDREPLATGVPLEAIGLPIAFDNIEAYYHVDGTNVEVYATVWLESDVLRPIRDHLEIEIYPYGKIRDHPEELAESVQAMDPQVVINKDTFKSFDWLEHTVISDILKNRHHWILALSNQMLDEEYRGEIPEDQIPDGQLKSGMLTIGNRLLKISTYEYEPEPLIDSDGKGVFIKIPDGRTAKYHNVVDFAAEKRFESGIRLLRSGAEVDEMEVTQEAQTVLTELLGEYRRRVASFSPPPFGPVIEQVLNRIEESE